MRIALLVALATLVGCTAPLVHKFHPFGDVRGVTVTTVMRGRWSEVPPPSVLLARPLEELPPYLGVASKRVDVALMPDGPVSYRAPALVAYPNLGRATLEAWKEQGWVTAFQTTEDGPLPHAFFPRLEPGRAPWANAHRARVQLDDLRVRSVEFLFDAWLERDAHHIELRGLLVEPRFARGTGLAAQLAQLGTTPAALKIVAVNPELGAIYAVADRPGQLLITEVDGAHTVTAVFQGPLPTGCAPWAGVGRAARRLIVKQRSLVRLEPWLRHTVVGERMLFPGVGELHATVEARHLRAALGDRVSPAEFLAAVRKLRQQELGWGLSANAPAAPLPKHRARLRARATTCAERAGAQELPVLAATWRWLAWVLREPGETPSPKPGLALFTATLPVLEGEVGFSSGLIEGTPLVRRSGLALDPAAMRRLDVTRWRVVREDSDTLQGTTSEAISTRITWDKPNPTYAEWEAKCEELAELHEAQLQAVPVIYVDEFETSVAELGVNAVWWGLLAAGSMGGGGPGPNTPLWLDLDPQFRERDIHSQEHALAMITEAELDVLRLDEPRKRLQGEATIPVSTQRYRGSVSRRHVVLAADGREVDRFEDTAEVSLELLRHRAIPRAEIAARDELLSLDEVRAQSFARLDVEQLALYRRILQRTLRRELERRLPVSTPPADAAQEVAWAQWWLGQEIDTDLRPALGDALELQRSPTPVLASPQQQAAADRTSLLLELLAHAKGGAVLPR